MRYARNEARDAFYEKADAPIGAKIKVPKFTRDPIDYIEADLFRSITDPNEKTGSKAKCWLCDSTRTIYEFIKVNHSNAFTIYWGPTNKQPNAINTTHICIHCLNKLYNDWRKRYCFTPIETLYMICSFANVYFDKDLAESILYDKDARYVDGILLTKDVTFVDKYMRKIEEIQEGHTDFWGADCSPIALQKQLGELTKRQAAVEDEARDEDKDNYNIIWGMYHYDPFETEEPKDQKRLRANLVTMIDDAMSGDLVRMNAALEIVKAYYRIEKIGETLNQLQATSELTIQNSNEIKRLVDAKSKETAMVTAFSKDHGFAAKYATAKSKGSGTLSAVIRDMKDAHYDPGVVNKYDIETSAAIKQVSDISAESIFKQISFTSAEYADMVREQADEIKSLTSKLRDKEEELRMFKEKEIKQELLEELKEELIEKGIPIENVDEMIQKEYDKKKKGVKS